MSGYCVCGCSHCQPGWACPTCHLSMPSPVFTLDVRIGVRDTKPTTTDGGTS